MSIFGHFIPDGYLVAIGYVIIWPIFILLVFSPLHRWGKR